MTREDFVKVVQVQDLFAFGKSILEILVGKYEEMTDKVSSFVKIE
jgi:hypothetical protein